MSMNYRKRLAEKFSAIVKARYGLSDDRAELHRKFEELAKVYGETMLRAKAIQEAPPRDETKGTDAKEDDRPEDH